MADLWLRETDPDALTAMIAKAVADAMRPLLTESAEPRLVDRERMAALLSISIPKLDTMTSSGTIPSILVGRRRLYQPAAVIDALAATPTDAHA